jgi:hypothetical protein
MGKTVQPVRPREAFEIRENIQKPFVLHDQLAFVLVKKTLTQQGRGGRDRITLWTPEQFRHGNSEAPIREFQLPRNGGEDQRNPLNVNKPISCKA